MDTIKRIEGIRIIPLKVIRNEKGDILHALRNDSEGYLGFGEAYFSGINYNEVKAWKKHFKMTLNLVVPIGKVKFVFFDEREESISFGTFNEFILSKENYQRLTIPPNIWMGFKGLGSGTNLILNIADVVHDPIEQLNMNAEKVDFNYNWR